MYVVYGRRLRVTARRLTLYLFSSAFHCGRRRNHWYHGERLPFFVHQ
jgi:hypothetical protein